jgi:hypothetical protein
LTRRWSILIALLVLGGCGGRSVLEAKRQRWAVERRGLEDSLSTLEERLLADQARVRFWQEMRARHESVTAVACSNLDRHADGMALLGERQHQKLDALARKHRVAARYVPASDTAR